MKLENLYVHIKKIEKAEKAVSIRNEWIGWGNVNKKNVYMLDYEYLKKQIEGNSHIYSIS